MKIRTILVVDIEVDATDFPDYLETDVERAQYHNDMIMDGDLFVDDMIEHAGGIEQTTLVSVPLDFNGC